MFLFPEPVEGNKNSKSDAVTPSCIAFCLVPAPGGARMRQIYNRGYALSSYFIEKSKK
jgi:hypothetical protein